EHVPVDVLDVRVGESQRQQIVRRLLDEVDFTGEQRVHGLLVVGDRAPLHTVDLDDFAAGETRCGLGSRLVLFVFDVHGLGARVPLVALEDKRPEPVKSEICVLGSVSATRFGIMKGTLEDGLPSPNSTRPVGDLSFMTKVLGSLTSRLSTKVIN